MPVFGEAKALRRTLTCVGYMCGGNGLEGGATLCFDWAHAPSGQETGVELATVRFKEVLQSLPLWLFAQVPFLLHGLEIVDRGAPLMVKPLKPVLGAGVKEAQEARNIADARNL